jgi:hypothetical protein
MTPVQMRWLRGALARGRSAGRAAHAAPALDPEKIVPLLDKVKNMFSGGGGAASSVTQHVLRHKKKYLGAGLFAGAVRAHASGEANVGNTHFQAGAHRIKNGKGSFKGGLLIRPRQEGENNHLYIHGERVTKPKKKAVR